MTPTPAVGHGFSPAQPTGSTSSRTLGGEVTAPFSDAAIFGRAGVDPARATPARSSGRAVAASFPEAAPTAPVPTATIPDTGSTAEATA
ncbi:hypothetical protein [Amycolatopsis sp. cmx-8-4]|uniref:hypothetical protein n=1 Tax=Amycolatopsis sp. cmx-8-4 TaxID=2790947 RepID=UPI00397AFEE3